MRLSSRLPPLGIGGIESTAACDAGARPMQPTCMLTGTRALKTSSMYSMSDAFVQPMSATADVGVVPPWASWGTQVPGYLM